MITTSEDVAKHAGVSRATVSQILNGRGQRFAEATRDRVNQAALELGYEPSSAGRTLARGSSDFVIALIPHTTFGATLQDFFSRMTDELAAHGLTLVLRLATPSTASLGRVISSMKPAAVFSLTRFTDEERALIGDRGVTGLDPSSTNFFDYNHAIGLLQGRTLIAHGHRRLAFAHLADARQDPFGADRENGLREACREAGLPEPESVGLDVTPDDADRALDELGGTGFAVACYNDDVATALLSAATRRGWRVPEDLALIGMDHTTLGRLTLPPLTTVDYDLEIAAEAAIHGILAITGHADTARAPERQASLRVVPGGSI
ncbi:transcriptional regulator, LacI family [Agromyces sp. CF514]|uniref:LacI family DNA-binding transcriptional regulator n=1 Tax=Agromyces sp. CF514 TaxID=1881031 RepID=UPI0008E20411|nr:LacI family DNA-binding transcriptional regulator [Agromyces sp. CF514]SFR84505.1 transcriptional regulator, LacI family [Agromyces sp. CF514]